MNNFLDGNVQRPAIQTQEEQFEYRHREITLEPADNARLLSLCGPRLMTILNSPERRLGIEINRRDNQF